MKRKILFPFFIMILVSLIAAGCSESTPRHSWVTKWVQNPTCQPPCWENITPGVTKISDAPDLLQKIPEVTEMRGPDKRSSGGQCVDWYMEGCGKRTVGSACTIDEKNDLISYSYLRFYLCHPGAEITLEEVILAFGPPTYVLPDIGGTGGCGANIIFLDKGMRVNASGAPGGKTMKIAPNWIVSEVELFPTGSDFETTVKTLRWDHLFSKDQVTQWAGYTSYPCYKY